ncbi:hypothetical protein CDAR_39631 [Caerostris darwini]|uniref:Uncharacterized protein n=1 Tax=Caerostris darwini TaxID=1538125 RepID=A0AAV4U6D9_9ARAC|nr:hypothetical protein CDAR_39631 [Caerostris darwini]
MVTHNGFRDYMGSSHEGPCPYVIGLQGMRCQSICPPPLLICLKVQDYSLAEKTELNKIDGISMRRTRPSAGNGNGGLEKKKKRPAINLSLARGCVCDATCPFVGK